MKIKVDCGDSWTYDYTKNHWEIIYFIWIKYMGCELSLFKKDYLWFYFNEIFEKYRGRDYNQWTPGSDGEGHGNPLQYSCLENPMDGEAW